MPDRRLFVAVDLAIPVVERLAMFQDELTARVDQRFDGDIRLRTVDAENIHITLKFLGDTPPEMVPVIGDTLEELCEPLFPFDVHCQNVGAFPNIKSPRILWAGLDDEGAEVMTLLQTHVERDLHELGIDRDRRDYHPHVTLARIKSRKRPSFESLLQRYDDVSFGKSFINDIVLYESHLDHNGPQYRVIQRYGLGDR